VSTISRWRNGVRKPGAYYAQVLAAVFETTQADLGLIHSPEEADLKRREFNRLAGLALAASLVPGSFDLERMGAALGLQHRADRQTVEQLRQLTTTLLEQVHAVAPDMLLPVLRGHLDACLALVRDFPSDRQLNSIAGSTAQSVGWMYYLLGRRGDAHVHYVLESSLGDQADNAALQARALTSISKLHSHIVRGERRPSPTALACLNKAATLLGSGWSLTPLDLRSWVASCQAEELAVAGNSSDTYLALDRAEATVISLDGLQARREEAYLLGYRGTCLLLLGHLPAAVAVLERALISSEPEFVADRCVVTTDLASAYAQLGEPERACELLAQGFDMAIKARLAPRIQRILSVRRYDLTAYESTPMVRVLDERLQSSGSA
jgi:hypothetical protein